MVYFLTIPKSTIETPLRKFPSMPKWVVFVRHLMVTVDGSHCTSPGSIVQTQYGMKSSPCIPDIGWPSTCSQTKIPVPPMESALGFSCATSKWSRFIWTTLGCATCCAWCDHSWWSCISRLTVHRWCWSWRAVVLKSCHRCVLLILPYIGVDGKQIVPM